MTIVFMFPGQSSRYPGMLPKAAALTPENGRTLARASEVLNWDLAHHFRAENDEAYTRNKDVQVSVFLANYLFMRAVQAAGVDATWSLGLSLGEYNHLVHIGALSFEQALLAVEARGEAYDAGPRGFMASIQPIELDELRAVVERVQADHGVLEVVNLNSPRQHVIAGEPAAVEAAVAILEEEYFVHPEIIERQVPMHSTMFETVGRRFREHLERVEFAPPTKPYLPNRLGHELAHPTQADFVELCATHVHEPVYWRKSIDFLLDRLPGAVFVEVGPRAVLHNLMQRKWVRNPRFRTDSREDTTRHLAEVVAGLLLLHNEDGDTCLPSVKPATSVG